MNRAEEIIRVEKQVFDVCIIGGGITGAGLLAQATARGWKAILVEKNDLASGTSSRSSKVIHGGLRYLKYFQFRFVKEALLERRQLLDQFSYLVKPVPFIYPSYGSKAGLYINQLFLSMYDYLAGKSVVRAHTTLNKKQVLENLPSLKQDHLRGGILYWEALTNDARLTIDVISGSAQKDQLVLNYMAAKSITCMNDTVKNLDCIDQLSGNTLHIKAKVYINATGVWTDEFLQQLKMSEPPKMKPSKGIHVIVQSDKLSQQFACIVPSVGGDKRQLYSLPWENGLTILGTTDTEYAGEADKVMVAQEEVQYLLDALNHAFPGAGLSITDIISVYGGLRPLLRDKENASSYSRSREYQVWWSRNNFINIAGGKLTSFQSMGKKCIDIIGQKFKHLPGKQNSFLEVVSKQWSSSYGPFGNLLDEIRLENKVYNQVVSDNWPLTIAEVIFFTRHQFALQVEDLLTRRTTITYSMKRFDEKVVEAIATIMSKELCRDHEWEKEQKLNYFQHWLEFHPSYSVMT